ncbi:hypothetical protein PO883_17025 [Massilia sp. DJPM01]|uniref:hypothetical protein n=1 Tax=Massilia sp. DJPM01 TaxID=3024404 RepID=UPI00259DAD4F|nr:hypothetical protein [Massilia sp. DJPM01]MDM5178907.1 hypothetical protein [Massilia sp. DJPM01]
MNNCESGCTVLSVKPAYGIWRYLWPFQTWNILIWMLCILTLGGLTFTAIVLLWFDPASLPWTLTGALIGAMWMGPYRYLPDKMVVALNDNPSHFIQGVEQFMLQIGYIVDPYKSNAKHIRFRPKRSMKPGAFIFWAEEDVDLLPYSDNKAELLGPPYILERLRRHWRSKRKT